MDFNGTVVVTPYDNPSQYQPDWRHHMAKLINDDPTLPIPHEIRKDPWVKRQVQFLQYGHIQRPGFINQRFQDVQRASWIYREALDTNVRDYLEPLLLTDQTYAVIAQDIGQTPGMVEHYERVYWACRAEDGRSPSAELVKLSFALGTAPDVPGTAYKPLWRFIGAQLGYTALTYIWCWQHPAGVLEPDQAMFRLLAKLSIGSMLKLTVTGKLQAFDFNQFFGQYISYERYHHEVKGGGRNEAMEQLMAFHKMMAPRMKDTAQSIEALTNYHAGDQNMLEAQDNIRATDVPDKGGGAANTILMTQLQKALEPIAKQYQE